MGSSCTSSIGKMGNRQRAPGSGQRASLPTGPDDLNLWLWGRYRLTRREPQAPEIQTMYNVPFPVSVIRTKMREEFERHRYVNKLPVVDVLLFQSHAEYQVHAAEHHTTPTRLHWLTGDDRKL